MIHHAAVIHSKADVDRERASIGAGTRVWQFATVGPGTIIGDDCTIGACATLTGPLIGDRCKISSGVVMGPGFKIGNDVFIGPNVVLANDVWPSTSIEGYDDAKLRSGDHFAVIIGDGAMIGANAVILPGVKIGAGSVVAAGAVVRHNVPPGMMHLRNEYLGPISENWRERRMRFA